MRYTGDTGAARAALMLAASSAETRSSASRHSTQSLRACSTANCFWRPKPSHSLRTTPAPLRAAAPGHLVGAVGAARVHDHDLVGEGEALETGLDQAGGVAGDEDCGERGLRGGQVCRMDMR